MARKKKSIEKKIVIPEKQQPIFWNSGIQWFVLALFLFSGFSGLVYQVVWVRILKLIFGVTAFAASTVVSSYMAGLSIGSFYFGKRVDRSSSPIRLYGLLELGVGLYALASPFIFHQLDNLYTVISVTFAPNFMVFSLVRFVIAFLVILVPTVLMGGTLPVLLKFFVNRTGHIGKLSGYLYSFNTLGAVIGAFVTGFFLVRAFGVQSTIYMAAAVNICAGLAAVWVGFWPGVRQKSAETATDEAPEAAPDNRERRIFRLLLWGFGLSGMASLAYEILWTRSLLYFLGLTTYTFTTILTTFLIGIALGSMIASLFADRLRDHLSWFAAIELLIGFFALIVVPMIGEMYHISFAFRQWLGYNDWWANVGIKFILSFLIMLLPTLLMGATFPIAVKCYNKSVRGIGKRVGEIYAANTVGSIIGSFAAGFVLIPLLGLRLSISVVVLLNLFIALMIILLHPDLKRRPRYIWAGLVALVVIILALNVNRKPVILASVEFKGPMQRYKMLYYKEGIDASIAVLEDKITHERELNINGESTAFTIYQDMQVHKMLGHLPMLVNPDPHNVLVVGFGFGSTSWAATLYPNMQTDCVELVRDEIETAPYFEAQNHNVLQKPDFHLIIADGREYVKSTEKRYDVISFNAIHPKISPNLYTLDFYEMCKKIMSPDGTIIAWLPPNAITEREYQSLIKTFCTVFPNSSLWYVNPSHMLLMATLQPFRIDYQQFVERMSIPGVRQDLREENLDDPYELLSCFIIAGEELMDYSKDAPINSDDLPYIEFSRELSTSVNTDVMSSLGRLKQSVWPYLDDVADTTQVKAGIGRLDETKSLVSMGQVMAWLGQYKRARDYYNQALAISPGNRNALYLDGLIDRRKSELEQMIKINPHDPRTHQALGEIYMEENNPDLAFKMFNRAVQLDPGYAQAHHHLGVMYYNHNRPDLALKEFERAQQLDPEYGAAYFYAGLCYWKMGKLEPALQNFKASTGIDVDYAPAYYYLAQCYAMQGKNDLALKELDKSLLADPDYEPARLMRTKMQSGKM